MHVDLHQSSSDQRTNTQPGNGGAPEETNDVTMLCTNWVCAGTFEDHEWVSESTITQPAEEVLGMELDYEIGFPCVVQ